MTLNKGWIPDLPDIRDALYNDVMKAAAAIKFPIRGWFSKKTEYPVDIDLRTRGGGQFPPVFNQGDLSDCCENAWAAVLAYVESKETGGKPGIPLSRLFMYYNARSGKPSDTGSSVRAAVKAVSAVGVCDESLWPYVETTWAERPSDQAFTEAVLRKTVSYARLTTLDDMLHCLATGYPFIFGASIYGEFQSVSGAGVVPMPTSKSNFDGGHCLTAVGYDLAKNAFLVRNSWGVEWGNQGHAWMPFDYVLSPLLCDDFWTARSIPSTP